MKLKNTTIEWPDILVVAFYFIFVIGFGLWVSIALVFDMRKNFSQSSRKNRNTATGFFLGGSKLGMK